MATLVQEKWKGMHRGGGPIVAWLKEQVFYYRPLISTRGGEKAVHSSNVCCTPLGGWMWGKRRRRRATNSFILLLNMNVLNAPWLKCNISTVNLFAACKNTEKKKIQSRSSQLQSPDWTVSILKDHQYSWLSVTAANAYWIIDVFRYTSLSRIPAFIRALAWLIDISGKIIPLPASSAAVKGHGSDRDLYGGLRGAFLI